MWASCLRDSPTSCSIRAMNSTWSLGVRLFQWRVRAPAVGSPNSGDPERRTVCALRSRDGWRCCRPKCVDVLKQFLGCAAHRDTSDASMSATPGLVARRASRYSPVDSAPRGSWGTGSRAPHAPRRRGIPAWLRCSKRSARAGRARTCIARRLVGRRSARSARPAGNAATRWVSCTDAAAAEV
jgi:hypothetical protein